MRKGNNVLYLGELYKVHQKRGEAVTIYNPRAKYPEATMITTSIYKVQPAPDKYGYRVSSYKTDSGHVRVLIFQINDTFPMLDIPASEAEAHMSEIRTSTCGRAWFIDNREKDHEPDTATGAHTGSEITTTGADKAPEEATTRQEGPTTAESTTAGETPTTAETAPKDATIDAGSRITCPAAGNKITSDAGTAAGRNITPGTSAAENAPGRPETSTPAQDTTGSDTRPPRATEDATTGNAAGSYITTANQEPGTAAGDHTRPGPAAGKSITGAGKNITTPGHACENAPGRTERAQAEQVHTQHTKSPPRAAQKAGNLSPRRGPQPQKQVFGPNVKFRKIYRGNFDPPQFSSDIFPVFKTLFVRPISRYPLGVQKSLAHGRRENFKKNL